MTREHPTSPAQDEGVRLLVVGAGGMARHHVRTALAMSASRPDRQLADVVLVEPNAHAADLMSTVITDAGRLAPVVETDLDQALARHGAALDVAMIVSPHALHHDQMVACLEAGLDVLVEKPMVTTVAEAESVLAARDKAKSLLVVGFNGSLSPQIRKAVELLRAKTLGELVAIHGSVWQNWKRYVEGTWRTVPAMSGGGFVFDTGAHLLNTTCDLAGEDVVEVSAWLDNRGWDVDLLGSIMARTSSGTMISLAACGDTGESCTSDLRAFCTEGFLHTGVWGERLVVQMPGKKRPRTYPVAESLGTWDMFCDVRAGLMANPSPAELGLRMARLWDLIKASAAEGGRPMTPDDL